MAEVNDKLQLQKVETWFDPLEMFRQIVPHGIVNKQPISSKSSSVSLASAQSRAPAAAACPVLSKSSSSLTSSQSALAMTSGCPVMSSPLAEVKPNNVPKTNGELKREVAPATDASSDAAASQAVSGSTADGKKTPVKAADVVEPREAIPTANADLGEQSIEPTTQGPEAPVTHQLVDEPKETTGIALEPSRELTAGSTGASVSEQGATEPRTQPDVAESQSQPPQHNESHEASTATKPDPLLVTPLSDSQPEQPEARHPVNSSSVPGPHEISALKSSSVKADDAVVDSPQGQDYIDAYLEQPAETVSPHPHDVEHSVHPSTGEAVAAVPQPRRHS